MRPIVSAQNPLRYPLNELFGTQAHVRLLRVMANEVDGPLTTSDVAKRAGLTVPGAQKALEKLWRSGFIHRVGGGRKHQYEFRCSDRLMQVTQELFQVENERYEQLLAGIKKEIGHLTPHPIAVWIQSPPREIGEPLTLGMLHETRHLTNCIRQLRAKLNQLEKTLNLTIEMEGYTRADIFGLQFHDVTLVYGVMPSLDNLSRQQINSQLTHREKEQRLLALSRKLARAIRQDTSLLRRAKNHIDRLLSENQGTASRDLLEWRDILDMYSIQRLSQFITSTSERANRLRRSNPFFAILNTDERTQLINGLEDENDTGST